MKAKMSYGALGLPHWITLRETRVTLVSLFCFPDFFWLDTFKHFNWNDTVFTELLRSMQCSCVNEERNIRAISGQYQDSNADQQSRGLVESLGRSKSHSVIVSVEDGVETADKNITQDPERTSRGRYVHRHETRQAHAHTHLRGLNRERKS